ncbi:hypothetical protein KCU65_g398, partial [Aureobasidium melanogenum]
MGDIASAAATSKGTSNTCITSAVVSPSRSLGQGKLVLGRVTSPGARRCCHAHRKSARRGKLTFYQISCGHDKPSTEAARAFVVFASFVASSDSRGKIARTDKSPSLIPLLLSLIFDASTSSDATSLHPNRPRGSSENTIPVKLPPKLSGINTCDESDDCGKQYACMLMREMPAAPSRPLFVGIDTSLDDEIVGET